MLSENIYRPSAKTMRHSARKMLIHRCEIVAAFQGSEPTGRATGAPDHKRLDATASGGAGGQDVAAGIVIGPEMGPVGILSEAR